MIKNVLFVCTGNSCRSQMAEALVNDALRGQWTAFSAGIAPEGYVHPMALEALRERGIIHNGRSKPLEVFDGIRFDVVITLCDNANAACPAWVGSGGQRVHMPFRDPFPTRDPLIYRQVLEQIEAKLVPFLQTFGE